MSTSISGVVTNGVVIPNSPLPEGARVEIHFQPSLPEDPAPVAVHVTPGELRKMPREKRQAILAPAAAMAEDDYRNDKELTGFDAFSEEEVDDHKEVFGETYMPSLTIRDEVFERLAKRASELKLTVEELIAPLLDLAAEGTGNGHLAPLPIEVPYDEWKKKFDAWMTEVQDRARRYPPGFVLDDSRIHADPSS